MIDSCGTVHCSLVRCACRRVLGRPHDLDGNATRQKTRPYPIAHHCNTTLPHCAPLQHDPTPLRTTATRPFPIAHHCNANDVIKTTFAPVHAAEVASVRCMDAYDVWAEHYF